MLKPFSVREIRLVEGNAYSLLKSLLKVRLSLF